MCLLSFPFIALILVLVPGITLAQSPAPAPSAASSALLVKPGQEIVFLGDSTTLFGWSSPAGFIHLVTLGLAKENVPVKTVQFGTQGSRPQELLDLYQKNVPALTPKADWLVLSCGLDALNQRLPGADLGTFQAGMKSLVDEAKAAGLQVMILTTSVMDEQGDAMDQSLAPYNDALRALAKSEGCALADVNAAEKAALPTLPPATSDSRILLHGSQLNTHGQRLVASEILKAFGVNAAQLADIEESWLDTPKLAPGALDVRLKGTAPITLRQYNELDAQTMQAHQSMQGLLNTTYAADLLAAMRAADTSNDTTSVQAAAQTSFAKDVADLVAKLPAPPAAAPATTTTTNSAPAPGSGILVKSGQKIAFMGDSITQFGWQHPDGYVNLVVRGLEGAGVKVEPIPAGVSGNTSKDMLARLKASVLDKNPDWMTLSCGVNDVWHGITGCDLETYKKNITSIVDQAQAAKIQVMILTATMIQESDNPFTQKQVAYNDFLRELAKERNLPLADLNIAEHEERKSEPLKHLTLDGVHMNPEGNQMMAVGVLKAFGLNDTQLARAEDYYLDTPEGAIAEGDFVFMPSSGMTLRESDALEQQAEANKQTLAEYLAPVYWQALVEQAKADAAQTNLGAITTPAQALFAQKVADLVKNPPPTPAPASTPAAKP
jgi:lysophospholipase L1-like esterase